MRKDALAVASGALVNDKVGLTALLCLHHYTRKAATEGERKRDVCRRQCNITKCICKTHTLYEGQL